MYFTWPPSAENSRRKDGLFITMRKVNKKGMEMWEIVLIIIALVLMLVLIVWYGFLKGSADNILSKVAEWF